MMDAFSLLHNRLYPFYAESLTQEPRCDDAICEASGRFPNEWHESPRGYYSDKKHTLVQSETCRMLSLRSKDIVGSATDISAQSLIGFMSCFIIVPVKDDERVQLWVSGKAMDRMSPTCPFELKPYGGNRAKLALLEEVGAALVIDSSMRKELWFKTLLIGNDNTLVVCGERGAVSIPRTGWNGFKNAYLAIEKTKDRNEAKVILRGLFTGRLNTFDERVQKFYKDQPLFTEACQKYLPDNPYAKIFYVDALGGLS